MSNYVSPELFHFVGARHPDDDEANFKILTQVINQGQIGNHPGGDGWGRTRYSIKKPPSKFPDDLVVPDVTCFCDIPFEALPRHLATYGPFGISVLKPHAIMHGCRPVIYWPTRHDDRFGVTGTTVLEDVWAVYDSLTEHLAQVPEAERRDLERHLGSRLTSLPKAADALHGLFARELLSFLKFYDSELQDDDKNNFYMEREWRRLGNLKFKPQHVGCLVVPDHFVDRAIASFPQYASRVRPSPAS